MRSVGIMGGTFDPIHNGHLVAAEAARHSFGLERVVFVPAAQPPHKGGREITPPGHRYLMTVLATMTNPYFDVSRVELEREGPSYTVDTVKHFRSLEPDGEFYFITGTDAILEICTWQSHEELLDLCQFIAATRPGYSPDALFRLEAALGRERLSRVHTLEVPALAISSSDIRERVRNGQPVKYLLPETVENYISKYRIYLEK